MIVTADTGQGTTYERWALNKALLQICAEENIGSIFEGPGDGISGIIGINSLALGLRGLEITLVLAGAEQIAFTQKVWTIHAPQANLRILETGEGGNLPFMEHNFDLAWNFNVMPRAIEPFRLIDELCRISRKAVLIVVPNRSNYSFAFHRLQHTVSHQAWEHGAIDLMRPDPWRKRLAQNGMQVKKVFYVDCPWWPDLVDIHEFVTAFLPFLSRFFVRMKPENRMKWEANGLPYFHPEEYPDVHRRMDKLAFLEKAPYKSVNRFFGHHVAILALKSKGRK
jgi:hypothetical protein